MIHEIQVKIIIEKLTRSRGKTICTNLSIKSSLCLRNSSKRKSMKRERKNRRRSSSEAKRRNLSRKYNGKLREPVPVPRIPRCVQSTSSASYYISEFRSRAIWKKSTRKEREREKKREKENDTSLN